MIEAGKQATYTDFESMANLRQQARNDPKATLKQVAKHFESLYLNMMLKSMRQASMGDPLFDSNNSALYRDMYDKQIALQMSQHQGIGLADVLVKQLQGHVSTSDNQQINADVKQEIKQDISRAISDRTYHTVKVQDEVEQDPVTFESHAEFVETLMPYAERASEELNVSPQLLIAQAALETGWGQYIQKISNGKSSYNLFNIKADSRWDGERLTVNTLEYRDGVARKENAAFRVYNSFAESFKDYVNFVRSNPRYQKAIENSMNPEAYAQQLQQAGYATDPQYANKVIDIFQREIVSAPYSEFLTES